MSSTTMASTSRQGPTLQSSQAEVWYLKQITFRGQQFSIITQNFNGPCSLIAICNILILRGDIRVLPRTRQTVSYEFLSQLVAEYLLSSSPDIDISAALSILPYTQKGMDLNPLFTSATTFRPSSLVDSSSGIEAGGELALFLLTGIPLVHGWLVEPDSPSARAMLEEGAEDYDSAVELIAEADYLTGGLLVQDDIEGEAGPSSSSGGGHRKNRRGSWTEEEHRKIRNALTIRAFIDSTSSQLTYHGLFHLASTLPSGELVALFRSSHLSVLYKDGEDLVLDGDTFEDGVDYVDPVPPTLPLRDYRIKPSNSAAKQKSADGSSPQPEPPSTMPIPAPSTPPLPGAYSITHTPLQPPDLNPNIPTPATKDSSSSSSQLEVPGADAPQLQLPQSQSQSHLISNVGPGMGVEDGQQQVPPVVASTSDSSSPPSSTVALIPSPTLSHSQSHSRSRTPSTPSSQPPIDQEQPQETPTHPQDPPGLQVQVQAQHQHPPQHQDDPPSPFSQLQRLGRTSTADTPPNPSLHSHSTPSKIQQASSQSTARTSTKAGSALYTLVTDQVFLHEPSVVWERIEDVDGADGMFVDGWFVRSSPAGGDFAGRSAEETARDIQEAERAAASGVDPVSDHELARQLQAEEEHYHFARLEWEQRVREEQQQQGSVGRQQLEERERRRLEEANMQRAGRKKKEKKEKECVVM